jgi:hypothetical protein
MREGFLLTLMGALVYDARVRVTARLATEGGIHLLA